MRRLASSLFLAVAALSVAPPALAERGGGVECGETICDALARSNESKPSNGDGGSPSTVQCTYRPVDLPAGTVVYELDGTPIVVDGTGQWYDYDCVDADGGHTGGMVYSRPKSAEDLRNEARARLAIPSLRPTLNPPGEQTVNFRSLLWVDQSAWRPASATASVPGLSVTVAAAPTGATWTMGDGGTVECDGPGVPYDPTKSEADQDTSCSYVYRHSSAGQPGDVFALKVTVHWAISWSVTGAPGGGPLAGVSRTSEPVDVRVGEVQAVNTRNGA